MEQGIEHALDQKYLRACIRESLERLKPEQRDVVNLSYFQERSCAEVAAMVRCPIATVRTRMFYARKQLRQSLASQRDLLCG